MVIVSIRRGAPQCKWGGVSDLDVAVTMPIKERLTFVSAKFTANGSS